MASGLPLETQNIRTRDRCEMIEVTQQVAAVVTDNRVNSGYVIVYVPHTTAAITIQENADPDVKSDLLRKLEKMIPRQEAFYDHAEGNSDSHLKASLIGSSVTVLIEGGRLVLGQWQGIYFCEFDGPRSRQMHVKVIELDRSSQEKKD